MLAAVQALEEVGEDEAEVVALVPVVLAVVVVVALVVPVVLAEVVVVVLTAVVETVPVPFSDFVRKVF